MSRAPTASALISTFVRDIPHSLLILVHDFIGQRWPSSAIASFRTARGRPRPPPSAADGSASILRVTRHAAWAARPVGRLSRPGRRAAARARDRAGLL